MIDTVAPVMPMVPEYAQAARAYWQASRHPGNIEDMRQAMAGSENHTISRFDKAVVGATTALVGFQASPLNEGLITNVGGATIENFHSLPLTFAAVGGAVVALDGTIGVGTSYLLDRFRPAVSIMHERYGRSDTEASEATQANLESDSKVKRGLGMWSLAFVTGGAGAISYYDYKDGGRDFKENVKVAAAATTMLAATVGGIAVGVHGVGEVLADHGHPGVLEATVDALKVFIPALFVGGFGIKALRNRMQLRKKVNAELAAQTEVQPHPAAA